MTPTTSKNIFSMHIRTHFAPKCGPTPPKDAFESSGMVALMLLKQFLPHLEDTALALLVM
jgi:hypothetical protein